MIDLTFQSSAAYHGKMTLLSGFGEEGKVVSNLFGLFVIIFVLFAIVLAKSRFCEQGAFVQRAESAQIRS